MSSQHWYDKNKGQPPKAFNAAARGEPTPQIQGSGTAKTSAPAQVPSPKVEPAPAAGAQHWYDANKGQPPKAFNAAARGEPTPQRQNSDAAKSQKPGPAPSPKNEAALSVNSQHWYDKNKGQPQKAFNAAAYGERVPPGQGSGMVKNSKPYPELRPNNDAARVMKTQTHNQQLGKESAEARQRNEAIRKATLERLRAKDNNPEQGRER